MGSVSHGSTKTRKVRSKKESFRTSSSGGPGVPDGKEDHSESDGLASRPKDDYVMVMSAFTPHINVAFDQAILARCNAIVLLEKYHSVMKLHEETSPETNPPSQWFYKLMRDLLFTRNRNETKAVWSTTEGIEASTLRRRVMLCILNMARRNVFGNFAVPPKTVDIPELYNNDGVPFLPIWLSKVVHDKFYVNGGHITMAVNTNEAKSDAKAQFARRQEIAVRACPTRSEVGFYVCDLLYRRLVNHFTPARKSARDVFFKCVGYLFVDWGKYPSCKVHDSVVVLRWAAPVVKASALAFEGVVDVPCETYAQMYDDTLELNGNRFRCFVRNMDDVTLVVQHDVLVRKDKMKNAQRRRLGNTRASWRKAINLMEVVLFMLSASFGLKSEDDVYDMSSKDASFAHISTPSSLSTQWRVHSGTSCPCAVSAR